VFHVTYINIFLYIRQFKVISCGHFSPDVSSQWQHQCRSMLPLWPRWRFIASVTY